MLTEWEDLRGRFLNGGPVSYDALRLLCGKHIGSGCYRDVFVFALDESRVIKFETGAASFENVMEWKAWERMGRTPEKKWLAACHHISPNGAILIQDRTHPPPQGYKWPPKVPSFLRCDMKHSNFGLIGRRFVCHDYGFNLHSRTIVETKMRRADWF